MGSLVRGGGRVRRMVLAAGLGAWVISASPCEAGGGPEGAGACPTCHKVHKGPRGRRGPCDVGTLGYGPPGLYPGFQGFGIGYHPGYGYGGSGRGTGAEGGYPLYGGPGYPHPEPSLRRIGGTVPFVHYGGPGGPVPGGPHYFGGVGPLAPDQPVVAVDRDPRDPAYGGDYGCFTGMLPYPETTFAPFVTIAATGGSSSGVSSASSPNAPPNTAPAPGETLDEHGAVGTLGVEVEPVDDPDLGRGLKLTRVYPGRAADDAGLRFGDVISSINGYVTQQPGHLTWIIGKAAADKVLRIRVRSAADGKLRTVTARLP